MPKGRIRIIGCGVGKTDPPYELIRDADIVFGGERFISEVREKEKFPIKGDISLVLERIRRNLEDGKVVAVLSDGDPLFFGIGKRIVEEFGKENVEVFPNITVLQLACSRICLPWEKIKVVSLHGKRDIFPLLSLMMKSDIIGVYTDRKNSPKKIAYELLKRSIEEFSMIVFEDLGTERERIREFEIKDAVEEEFSELSFVILKRKKRPEIPLKIGTEDDLYLHERGLITKKEIRVVSLSMLSLEKRSIVWDIGAGSGSVGIECATISDEGRIYCVEKDYRRYLMIKENIRRMGAYIVEAVWGEAPYCLKDLPPADRIFLGGGISEGLLESLSEFLKKEGIIVMNITLIENLMKAISFFKKKGWNYDLVQISVSRSKNIKEKTYLSSLNPVFILRAEKR